MGGRSGLAIRFSSTSAAMRPISAPGIGYFDLLLMLAVSLLLLPLMATGMKLSRLEGAFLLLIYAAYTVGRFWIIG